jgi:hypothetical protein
VAVVLAAILSATTPRKREREGERGEYKKVVRQTTIKKKRREKKKRKIVSKRK